MESSKRYAKQDEQLYCHIQRLQQGYTDSFNEIYNLSGKYLYKIIYDIVQDYHTTEDMLQETFVKIYNNIGSLQSPQAYYVWAGRIATNLCIRYLHKYRNEVLQTVTDDGEGNEEFTFDTVADDNEMFIPESVMDNKEHQRMIGAVIDSLSIEQKLAVQCFYFEEMSVKEIAQVMGCSEGTIKSRLNYARKAIKEEVLHIEKTQGTKLYSLGVVPVLLLLYRGYAEGAVASATMATTTGTLSGTATGELSGTATGELSGTATGTLSGATTATGAAVATGISGKLIAIIAAAVVSVGALIGGGVAMVKLFSGSGDKVEDISGDEGQSNSTESAKGERHDDIIPAGARYEVAASGEILEEGDSMPKEPGFGDRYYYNDYKYELSDDGWKVELNNITDYQSRKKFGNILEAVAGVYITEISFLFADCKNMLEAPEIPKGVTNMEHAFYNCVSLIETPRIPESVTNMNNTFQWCTSLQRATNIPSGVEVPSETFCGCSNLIKAPVISEGVKYLAGTFSDCTKLEVAPAIPESVENMFGAFWGCESLKEAPVIPSGVTNMDSTFYGCKSLSKAPVIPDGVVNMAGTFSGCRSLVEAPVIPKGVSDLTDTFYYCKSITEAPEIPSGVTIMKNTFAECASLIEAPVIPEGVTDMEGTFADCVNLMVATEIPSGVTNMARTFFGCAKITVAPQIPYGVVNMSKTFMGCENITVAPAIPETVTNMTYTFYGCLGLRGAITINANPTEYEYCFWLVDMEVQNIELTGSSAMLEALKGTAGAI